MCDAAILCCQASGLYAVSCVSCDDSFSASGVTAISISLLVTKATISVINENGTEAIIIYQGRMCSVRLEKTCFSLSFWPQ